jgi:hypothetical protein
MPGASHISYGIGRFEFIVEQIDINICVRPQDLRGCKVAQSDPMDK